MSTTDWSKACIVPDCARSIDVVLISSDRKCYGSHSDNLQLFNDRFPFPASGFTGSGNRVLMKETASIVHLLILFSHNIEHPKLLSHDLDTVTGVLEAASIYGNRPAVQACKSAISEIGKRSPEDALRVLRYKGTHSDFEDIDDMARRTMKLSTQHVISFLRNQPTVYMTWSRYKDKWERSMSKFRQVLDRGNVSRDYTNFGYLGDLWTVFSSEVEAQEVPTSAGVKEIACLINGLDVKEYKGLDPWLVWELESVIKGFPKWCDMIVM